MRGDNFFKYFCSNDEEQALVNLYAFKNVNYPILKTSIYPFIKNATDAALTEADIIQEVIIYFWENREKICRKNRQNFTNYFLQALKNKCIDFERKHQHKLLPKKISEREKKEIRWTENYTQDKEDELKHVGELIALELEVLTIFALHQISDHLKLLVVLNLISTYKKELLLELKNKGWLLDQSTLNTNFSQYTPVNIYKLKSKEVKTMLRLEDTLVKQLSDEVRKFKQYLKRKLNRKSLWKDIQNSH